MSASWREIRELTSSARWFLVGASLLALGTSSFDVIYNLYLLELGMGAAAIGRVNAAFVAGLAVGGIPAGSLSDRIGHRRVIIGSIVACLITKVLRATMVPEPTLLIVGFCDGLAYTCFWVASPALVGEIGRPNQRSLIFSLNGMLGSLVASAGSMMAGSLPQVFSTSLGVSLLRGERLTLTSMLFFLVPALLALSRGVRPNTNGLCREPSFTVGSDAGIQAKPKGVSPLPQIAIVTALAGLTDGLFFPFGNLFLKERLGLSPMQIGHVFAATQVLVLALFLVFPFLTRSWKKSHLLAGIRFLALPFVVSLAIPLPFWPAWACYAIAYSTFVPTLVVTDNIIVEVTPSAYRARATGVRSLFLSTGAIIANLTGGWLIQERGFQAPIFGTAVLGAALATALTLFLAHREPRPLERSGQEGSW